jgi:predicted ATP-dependent protease
MDPSQPDRHPARRLEPAELAMRCDPASLLGVPARDAEASGDWLVCQERAGAAAAFAIEMAHEGYHLFISGPPGTGRRALARRAIAAHVARAGVSRFDWVYVNNFQQPHRPIALQLPAGRGARLRTDMSALVDELRAMIPAMFDSEEYVSAAERINAEYKERAERALEEVGQEAQRRGLAMLRTPVGFTFAPQKDGEVLSTEAFEALTSEQRDALQRSVSEVQEQLVKVLHASMRLRKEHADRIRALVRSMTLVAVEHAVGDTLQLYADLPAVGAWLQALRSDVVEHAEDFRAHAGDAGAEPLGELRGDLSRYEVNLLVDAAGHDGSAIVEADLPTHSNLVGRVEHLARLGALVTDFRLIKAGLLHRANGGYLLVDALKLLTQPFAWDALKRALTRREIRIESMAEMYSLVSTIQLEPEPIPLAIKVVLVGERAICELLQRLDPEFSRLFRVQADLDDDLRREPQVQAELAAVLAAGLQSKQLLPASAGALARVIDHAARRAGDATRLDADVQSLHDVMLEAEHLARRAGRPSVEAAEVLAAIAARRERAARVDERHRDAMLRELLMIDTGGRRVGQVNALTVYEAGGETFGAPVRVTATSRIGDGQVVDVQRETRMAGPVHAKGVLILSSFLASRYSRLKPHAITASLVFEQTYGPVEGDSASLAELLALLSSIGDLPLLQSIAVTGSVNQLGDVQAVGGVDEKIEGFFDLCAARGLDGSHAVLVPEANARQLMLRDDVVQAVREGRFAVHAASHVDAALALLSGLPAGDSARPDPATANGRIAGRLENYSALRRGEPRLRRRSGAPRARNMPGTGP